MSPSTPREQWRHVTSHDGTDIAWRVDGPEGSLTRTGTVRAGQLAIVLCNGIACDETYFARVWEPLATDAPVIRWHYRGHGYSAPPANPSELTVSSVVRDLHAVLQAAKATRVVLVGHSYGVQVIGEAYRDHADRIAGLVALAGAYGSPLGTVLGANPGRYVFDLMRLSMIPPAMTTVWRTLLLSPIVYPFLRATGFISANAPPEQMRVWFEHLAERDMQLILRMMRAMQEHTTEDLLPRIDVPVVAVAGEDDWATPPRLARRMIDRVPDGRLVVVPGATHVLPIEFPQVVLAEIRGLLDRLDAR